MDTTIGTDAHLDRMRRAHTQAVAVALQAKFSEGMIDMARKGGIVPTPQLKQMCADFAARCADVVMQEFAVVQTRLVLKPSDVAPEHVNGTTQELIDRYVKPAMVQDIADAIMSAGLATPTLAIPPQMGSMPIFASWTFALREQSGPAAMPNAPRLDYGGGTSVYPRAKIPLASAETKPEADKPAAGGFMLSDRFGRGA